MTLYMYSTRCCGNRLSDRDRSYESRPSLWQSSTCDRRYSLPPPAPGMLTSVYRNQLCFCFRPHPRQGEQFWGTLTCKYVCVCIIESKYESQDRVLCAHRRGLEFPDPVVDGLLEKLTIVELEIKYTLLRDRQTNRLMANFARYTQRKSDRQTEWTLNNCCIMSFRYWPRDREKSRAIDRERHIQTDSGICWMLGGANVMLEARTGRREKAEHP